MNILPAVRRRSFLFYVPNYRKNVPNATDAKTKGVANSRIVESTLAYQGYQNYFTSAEHDTNLIQIYNQPFRNIWQLNSTVVHAWILYGCVLELNFNCQMKIARCQNVGLHSRLLGFSHRPIGVQLGSPL